MYAPPLVKRRAITTPSAIQPRRKRKVRRLRPDGGVGAGQDVRSISCSDVGSDNGPVGIMPSRSGSACSTLLAVTEGSKKGEGVKPGGMPAFKRDLQRVLADERYVLDAELVLRQVLHPREAAGRTRFAATLGAGTRPAQPFGRIRAVMPPLPVDLHDLAGAVDVDVDRERIGVFQWTLITGSWRND